jgi:hypothetical protein
VCASKSIPNHAPKRKPYKKPALEKLTLENAKKLLASRSDPADKNVEKLLKEINRKLERH